MPVLWPPDAKNWLIGKDPDARQDQRQEEKGMTEDEMVGWHHLIDGREFELAPGVGDGQGSLMCCSPWGRKESDTIEWVNWTDVTYLLANRDTGAKRYNPYFQEFCVSGHVCQNLQFREIIAWRGTI